MIQKQQQPTECFRTTIGGQALIEGILMRGPEKQAIVVRKPDGDLVTKVDERKNYYRQTMETLKGLETLPVFRTVIHVDSAVEWAQDNSTTVVSYRRSSRSAREYLDFAKEVEEKCR